VFKVLFTNRFKKDYKLCIKRNYNLSLLHEVVFLLEKNGEVPQKYNPHVLVGIYKDNWECQDGNSFRFVLTNIFIGYFFVPV
jgi:mRNA interferase YafQ